MDSNIQEIIKKNNCIVEDINQILHNEGIEINERLNIVVKLIDYKFNNIEINDEINNNLKIKLLNIIDNNILDKNELFQKVFMFYCNKLSKINLDQYYTPITIGNFISKLCIENKKIIDPACGTGDLTINYDGEITLWDISEEVVKMCDYNYKLCGKKCNLKCLNSIEYFDEIDVFDYCFLNPPFGTSTIVSDKKILDNYELGKNKKKEEIGILFIEKSMKLLKDGGVLFVILPNGYLGNSAKNNLQLRQYLLSYRIIAIIELPSNTFSRSGTGVSTSILIIQKIKMNNIFYDIYIKKINNIGYILNKKNTPYKYKIVNGKYIFENNLPILDNDLEECLRELKSFIYIQKLNCLKFINPYENLKFEILNTKCLSLSSSLILDINRYLNIYINVINDCISNDCEQLNYYIKNVKGNFKVVNDKEYIYLDIKQITSPIYNKTNVLYGYELPGRAKIKLEKYDIIISKLKGNITFTIILDNFDNIICTNGFALLRPKSFNDALIIFANLFTNDFKIQHRSLCTGSIMETISEKELKSIYIKKNICFTKYKNIIDALQVINNEL